MKTDDPVRRLEARVAQLEDELRQVREQLSHQSPVPWWESTAGMFKGDKVFAEIARLGQAARRAERKGAQKSRLANANGESRPAKSKR